MSNETRITLLEKVKKTQNGESWSEFAAIYDALIATWLRQQSIPSADADDIRQEVMQTVIQEIGGFDHSGRPGAFRSWLRKITANRMRQLWRRKQRNAADYGGANAEEIANQLDDDRSRLTLIWDAQHDRAVLNGLLGMLGQRFSSKSLVAFRRIAIAQEDAQRVADDLGMTLGAARVAQHRVLKALKELAAGMVD